MTCDPGPVVKRPLGPEITIGSIVVPSTGTGIVGSPSKVKAQSTSLRPGLAWPGLASPCSLQIPAGALCLSPASSWSTRIRFLPVPPPQFVQEWTLPMSWDRIPLRSPEMNGRQGSRRRFSRFTTLSRRRESLRAAKSPSWPHSSSRRLLKVLYLLLQHRDSTFSCDWFLVSCAKCVQSWKCFPWERGPSALEVLSGALMAMLWMIPMQKLSLGDLS